MRTSNVTSARSLPLQHGFACILFSLILTLIGCVTSISPLDTSTPIAPLQANALSGNLTPVRDPSLYRQGDVYYLFSTDPAVPTPSHYLPIRCSTDKITWQSCGQVFTSMPAWITAAVPHVNGLWAPDISFFHGLYHLYYTASTLGSQVSIIGLATNTTLDPADPTYEWLDRGLVLASHREDDFNALDPNILIDTDNSVWLTYGSYWSGIKQRQVDPGTGYLLASNTTRYDLASRPGVSDDAIEGSSLIQHGAFYYLFLSIDHCCESAVAEDNYKQIVGRATSPHGPFLDAAGTSLLKGGGNLLLSGNSSWMAPGGGTAYLDEENGDSLLVFHAINMSDHATPSLWLKTISWQNDWPTLN